MTRTLVCSAAVALSIGLAAAAVAQERPADRAGVPDDAVHAGVAAPADAARAPVAVPSDTVHAGMGGARGAAPLAEGSGETRDATVVVSVRGPSGEGQAEPVSGVMVQLHIMRPPHEMAGTLRQRTNDRGLAVFRADSGPGLVAYAEVTSGRRFFSPQIALDEPGGHTAEIDILGTSDDPSAVFAIDVQTIVELWEGYITFTEVWTLGVDQPAMFASDPGRPETLIQIPLPDRAEGARIVQPQEQARIIDNVVSLAAEVEPLGSDPNPRADLIVQYSIKSHDRARMTWERTLPMDIRHLMVVVPQTSRFERFPTLDVDIEAPRCGINTPSDAVCFESIDSDPRGSRVREGTAVRVARGYGRAGQSLEVTTVGWPSSPRWERGASILVGLIVAFIGFGLIARERGRRLGPQQVSAQRLEALRAQRDALFRAGTDIEARFVAGEMLERDYEVARERIRGQLGVIYRRLRELVSESASA